MFVIVHDYCESFASTPTRESLTKVIHALKVVSISMHICWLHREPTVCANRRHVKFYYNNWKEMAAANVIACGMNKKQCSLHVYYFAGFLKQLLFKISFYLSLLFFHSYSLLVRRLQKQFWSSVGNYNFMMHETNWSNGTFEGAVN